jgi:hypothetical protein
LDGSCLCEHIFDDWFFELFHRKWLILRRSRSNSFRWLMGIHLITLVLWLCLLDLKINLFFCFFPSKLRDLNFFELVLKYACLLDSIRVYLVLNYLFLEHLVAEFELVYTVNEILLTYEQTLCLSACALNGCSSSLRIFYDFLKTKYFI